MKAHQRGFTLVELIVVIVILGILAATALPRFVNLGSDARAAAMQAVAASMESAKQLVQGKWLAAGSATMASVDIGGGTTVTVVTGQTGTNAVRNGMPTDDAAGMGAAITVDATKVSCAVTGGNYVCTYSGITGCTVTYDSSTGTGPVTVAANSSTCN